MDFSNVTEVTNLLEKSQGVDQDSRNIGREAIEFVNDPDGQWDYPGVRDWGRNSSGDQVAPKLTFDVTSAIVRQITAQIDNADFDAKVKPAGGDATIDTAKLIDGMIRTVEAMSNAKDVYTTAGRQVVEGGFSAWRVIHDYYDQDSFDQDLRIELIPEAMDTVWFDPNAKKRDKSDAEFVFVLTDYERGAFQEMFPKNENAGSVGETYTAWDDGWKDLPDTVRVAQVYYYKERDQKLFLMTDGSVLDDTEETQSILDELAKKEITIDRERTRKKRTVYSRLFANGVWLNDEEETAFTLLPVIPVYGNYRVYQGKSLYSGVVTPLMDAQRTMNFVLTRQAVETALSPRSKILMTPKQAQGYEDQLSTLNTNHDPVQFYNVDEQAPPPQILPVSQSNPALLQLSETMRNYIGFQAGVFAANLGDNPGLQSGVAIENLQERGDQGSFEYIKALRIAIEQTARVLIKAIPKVYDATRMVRIMQEDGTDNMEMINSVVVDEQTGEPVTVNDLSKGKYDVAVTIGKSYENRQEEFSRAVIELAQLDPSILQMSKDILFSQSSQPGMDKVAERARQMALQQGIIPQSQLTEEELQAAQMAAQQPQQPDPAALIAMAEMEKAQADTQAVQVKAHATIAELQMKQQSQQIELQKIQAELQIKQVDLQQKELDAQRDDMEALRKIQNDERETAIKQQKQDLENDAHEQNMTKLAADTLKTLKEATGVDAVVGPETMEAYANQAEIVTDQQNDVT